MKSKRMQKIVSAVLAGVLSASMLTSSVFAADTLPYLGESAKGENQPYGHGYRAEDLATWSPETDPYSEILRARVPLQNRNEVLAATQANPNLKSDAKNFVLAGDYGNAFFDSYPYTNEFSQYLFNYWQYVDFYGSWHGLPTEEVPEELYDAEGERNGTSTWKDRVTEFGMMNMPNSAYTNAAHKNGALSIGCIFQPRAYQYYDKLLEKDENGRFPAGDKLKELCDYYGFDGWFFNMEGRGISEQQRALLYEFFAQMRADGLYIQWYTPSNDFGDSEAGITTSATSIEEAENAQLRANSVFLNYNWSASSLQRSADKATSVGLNPFDAVFAGYECVRDKWGFSFDNKFLNPEGDMIASMALFQSEMVHSNMDEHLNKPQAITSEKDEYQWMAFDRERAFWSSPNFDVQNFDTTGFDGSEIGISNNKMEGISKYIAERSVVNGDSFVTTFNTGHGMEYRKNGELSNGSEWSNINIQDILPTWQWWFETEGQKLHADFDYGEKLTKTMKDGSKGSFAFDQIGAYEGGSSLVVYGDLDAENFMHLYKTDLSVSDASKMEVTFKKSSDDTAAMKLGLIFADDTDNVVKLDIADSDKKSDSWVTSTIDLSAYAGRKIAAFGLVFDGEAADYQMNIGKMRFAGEDKKPATPTGFQVDKAFETKEMIVSWDIASYDDVKQYNVYAVKDGKEIYLGGIYDEIYYLKNVENMIAEADLAHVTSVAVTPDKTSAYPGSSLDFDALVNGFAEKEGQITLQLRAVGNDGTESDPATVTYDYANTVKNVEVQPEDGKLNVTWDGGEADITVITSYEKEPRTWTGSGNGSAVINVASGAEADGARYTMNIKKKDGSVLTYDGRLDDSYSTPYSDGKIQGNSLFSHPLSKDWYRMHYQIVTDGERGEKQMYERGHQDGALTNDWAVFKEIPKTADGAYVILEDYNGNMSEEVFVKNCASVIVTAPENSVQASQTLQLSAEVKNYKESDEVIWSLQGAKSEKTTIDQKGLLTVDVEESASRVTVVATAKEDAMTYGSMQITILPATALTPQDGKVYQGETQQFTVVSLGTPLPASDFEWTVSVSYGEVKEGTVIDQNGLLTVDPQETAYYLDIKAKKKDGDVTYAARASVAPVLELQNTSGYYAAPGKTTEFVVTKKGEKQAADQYDWSVEGAKDPETKFTEPGKLFVSENEQTFANLTIKATSKENPEQTVSTTAFVYDMGYRAASAETNAPEISLTAAKAEAPAAKPVSTKEDLSSNAAVSQEVTWTVEGAQSKETKINADGTLNIAADETAKTLTVRATSVADPSKSGTAVVDVTDRKSYFVEVITEGKGKVTPGSGTYLEGEVLNFTLTPDKGYEVDKVTIDGKTVEVKDNKFSLTVSETHQVVVTFKESTGAPDTGDSIVLMLLSTMFFLSGVGMCTAFYLKKKRA